MPSQVVTKSALTQARKHLSHTAFIDLNQQVINAYYAEHPDLKTWKGFRLCAIDGSQLRLPNEPDIIKEMGYPYSPSIHYMLCFLFSTICL